MSNFLAYAWMAVGLIPTSAWAQAVPVVKDPLNYPLRQYAFILGVSVAGGIVNYFRRATNGDLPTLGIAGLIGEMATSAFTGVLVFWACEFFNAPPLATAGLVALSGHAGGSAVVWMEAITKRKVEKLVGVTSPAPLGKD